MTCSQTWLSVECEFIHTSPGIKPTRFRGNNQRNVRAIAPPTLNKSFLEKHCSVVLYKKSVVLNLQYTVLFIRHSVVKNTFPSLKNKRGILHFTCLIIYESKVTFYSSILMLHHSEVQWKKFKLKLKERQFFPS